MQLNPNLMRAAPSPIMEAVGWVRAASFPDDRPLIDLSQAAPRNPPPESLRQALAQTLLQDPAAHFYGAVLGNDALRSEIARQWSGLYGGDIEAEEVAITAGCNQAFCAAISTVCAPGDAVILPVPWYFNHKMWLDMAGLQAIPLPCHDLRPDPDMARAAITPSTRAIVLVSPNNPTGAEYSDALLQSFYELARDTGLALIVDETYRDFRSIDGTPHGLFKNPAWRETLIHLYSFSKVYRMTGHRTGAMIASAQRLAQAEKFLDTVTICPAQTGQIAALHGLNHLAPWVSEQRAEFQTRRTALTSLFHSELPNWTLHGAGAYFAWVSPPGDAPAMQTARRLVEEQSLLILPGSMFLPEDMPTNALRIAFANTDADGLEETVARLSAFEP